MNPLAGALLAIHAFTIKYTSVVYLEALPAALSLITVLAYTRADASGLYKGRKQNARGRQRKAYAWLAISSLAFGLTTASKYVYAIVGIAILVHAILRFREQRQLHALPVLFVWGGSSIAIFFLANPILWTDPIARLSESIIFSAEYAQEVSASYPWWKPLHWLFQTIPSQPKLAVPSKSGDFLFLLDPLITLLALVGLPRLWKRHKVFALWLLAALLFLLIWTTKWPQYILILSAPLCLSAAEGIQMILTWTIEHPTTIFTPAAVQSVTVREPSSWLRVSKFIGKKGRDG